MISKRNKRGLAVAVILGAVIAFLPRFLTSFQSSSDVSFSFEEVKEIEQSIYKKQFATSEKKREEKRKQNFSQKKKYKLPPKKFDPNKTSKQDWLYLGLSDKQAEVVMKFLKRPVYSPEDLQKIYVIPDEVMSSILDSAFFPNHPKDNFSNKKIEKFEKKKNSSEIFDLNTVTKDQLESLYGIGPFYARKIVEYREQLGGYVSKNQLMELWKFDKEKFNKIQNRLEVKPTNIRKIDLNSATIEVLKKHPYINYSIANSIVKIREQHGKFSTMNQLSKSALVDQELIQKLSPYISLR